MSETSKIDADELPRKQTTVILEENVQPSSVSHLLSLDVQNIMIEDEIFSSSSNLGKLPKEAELQLDNMDLLEGDNLFLSVHQPCF